MTAPTSSRTRSISSLESSARQPGMDSSLSSVPPVWPRPRPESWGTAAPQAATSGASGRVILSPTPPVLCLSAVGRDREEKSMRSPLAIIAAVQRAISRRFIPLSRIAMARAEICSSATSPRVYASMTQSICSSLSSPRSRLVRMTEMASMAMAGVPSGGAKGAAPGTTAVPGAGGGLLVEVLRGERLRQHLRQGHDALGGLEQQSGAAELVEQLPAAAARDEDLAVALDAGEGRQPAAAGALQ